MLIAFIRIIIYLNDYRGTVTRVENNNEVFLRVTNHTGQVYLSSVSALSVMTNHTCPVWFVTRRNTSLLSYIYCITSVLVIFKLYQRLSSASCYDEPYLTFFALCPQGVPRDSQHEISDKQTCPNSF